MQPVSGSSEQVTIMTIYSHNLLMRTYVLSNRKVSLTLTAIGKSPAHVENYPRQFRLALTVTSFFIRVAPITHLRTCVMKFVLIQEGHAALHTITDCS